MAPPTDVPHGQDGPEAASADSVEERVAAVTDPKQALRLLSDAHLEREAVAALAQRRDLLTSYEVRKAVVFHREAPEVAARRLLTGLYWRDLVAVGADTRLRPTLRRAADRQLAQRLPGAAKGEKMAMARKAGPGLVQRLRDDPDPRVMAALLENPRLTEGQILPALNRPDAPSAVLEVVARDRRWGVRYPIRCALARNPATPVDAALRILPHLKKADLRAVTRQARVAAVVRKRAKLLLGGS